MGANVEMTTPHILEVRNVSKVFRIGGLIFAAKLTAVDDVSIALRRDSAEIVSIAGESGCGKTTLCRIILRIIEPTKGSVFYDGKDIFRMRGRELRDFRKSVQPIFQNPYEAICPFERVDFYLISTALNYGLAKSKADAIGVVEEALNTVGLDIKYIQGKYSNELSGGELQRSLIARALLSKPRILIADEPVSMIDASLRMGIINLFLDLKEKFNMSTLYITHDLATAYYVSDKIAIMYRGNIVEYGDATKVLEDPLHPYTKILLESIPTPDPYKKWKKEVSLSVLEIKEFEIAGCKFASRCPNAREICREKRPPDLDVESRRVKCWIFADTK